MELWLYLRPVLGGLIKIKNVLLTYHRDLPFRQRVSADMQYVLSTCDLPGLLRSAMWLHEEDAPLQNPIIDKITVTKLPFSRPPKASKERAPTWGTL